MPFAFAPLANPAVRPQRSIFGHLPAPVGGWNGADALSGMAPVDCVYVYNMIPFQYGLRSRLGYMEWVTGLDSDVRTILPFTGSTSSNDRLFACTSTGIWNCSLSTSSPTRVFGFSASNSTSGRGQAVAFTNRAGHFLAYCDESEGYVLYSETSGTWSRITQASTNTWVHGKAYIVGDRVSNLGSTYICTTGGTSATTGDGPSGGGTGITDGTVVWDFSPTISNADPTQFRHVAVWKNRLWFTLANSATAYFLDINAICGPASPIYFGPRFKYGGSLVGLWSWTLDGGQGIDDHLVAVSTGGDVVIYQGTDPALDQIMYPGTFLLKGVWWVGAVPPGRRFVSDFGGDVFILSAQGCVALSSLVSGGLVRDPNLYATRKISNLFNALMSERRSLTGWELRIHPSDNTLLINVPVHAGEEKEQLSMSLATKGWARHRGVPIACMDSWRGQLYFGTEDKRVCINTGSADAVTLAGTGATAIEWSLLTAFQMAGSARQKLLHFIRPRFITNGTAPDVAVQARFDFDLSEMDQSLAYPVSSGGSLWDVAKWDKGVWGNGNVAMSRVGVGKGMGVNVAVSLVGNSLAETTLAGFDVAFENGGFL